MKGKDTTMKLRFLLLFPLIMLSSCANNNYISNVAYRFDMDTRNYKAYDNKNKEYIVQPENYFEIKVDDYKVVNNELIFNELYVVSPYKLFVYYR